MLDTSFFLFLGLAIVSGSACWYVAGVGAVTASVMATLDLLKEVFPQLALGVIIAGFVSILVPSEKVARALGHQSGMKGLILATTLGAVMPGGPFASFPLVYALSRAGADIGTLIAFLIAWAAIGVHRLMIWEVPFMGLEFATLRLLSSIPIPILAGLMARELVRRYPGLRPIEAGVAP